MNLRNQRRLAADIMGVGVGRVLIPEDSSEQVSEALTREDVRILIHKGAIGKKPVKSPSKARARARASQKRKGRHKGQGKRKGKSPLELLTGERVPDWLAALGYPPRGPLTSARKVLARDKTPASTNVVALPRGTKHGDRAERPAA